MALPEEIRSDRTERILRKSDKISEPSSGKVRGNLKGAMAAFGSPRERQGIWAGSGRDRQGVGERPAMQELGAEGAAASDVRQKRRGYGKL